MSIRAIIVGLLAGLFIAGFGFVNDWVLQLESFNNGHLLPIFVIGTMFLFVVTLNPLLHKLGSSIAFKPRELAVIVGLMMIAAEKPLNSLQCLGILQRTAKPLPGASYDWVNDAGFGRIDPEAAITEARNFTARIDKS